MRSNVSAFMDQSISHVDGLRRAIELSEQSVQTGGGPFGAVILCDAEIVGEGKNEVTLSNDPTAHAEIVAIRDACRALDSFHLNNCILYSSCEPCPMCLAACYWSRIPTVYYANTRHDAASIGFLDQAMFNEMSGNGPCSITMHQLLCPEAAKAFVLWLEKEDRTPY